MSSPDKLPSCLGEWHDRHSRLPTPVAPVLSALDAPGASRSRRRCSALRPQTSDIRALADNQSLGRFADFATARWSQRPGNGGHRAVAELIERPRLRSADDQRPGPRQSVVTAPDGRPSARRRGPPTCPGGGERIGGQQPTAAGGPVSSGRPATRARPGHRQHRLGNGILPTLETRSRINSSAKWRASSSRRMARLLAM